MSKILDMLNLRCLGLFLVCLFKQFVIVYKGLEFKRASLVGDEDESYQYIDGM